MYQQDKATLQSLKLTPVKVSVVSAGDGKPDTTKGIVLTLLIFEIK